MAYYNKCLEVVGTRTPHHIVGVFLMSLLVPPMPAKKIYMGQAETMPPGIIVPIIILDADAPMVEHHKLFAMSDFMGLATTYGCTMHNFTQ